MTRPLYCMYDVLTVEDVELLSVETLEINRSNRLIYILWTVLFLLQRRKVLPFHQKRIPKRQKNRIRLAFVMIGGMNLFDC